MRTTITQYGVLLPMVDVGPVFVMLLVLISITSGCGMFAFRGMSIAASNELKIAQPLKASREEAAKVYRIAVPIDETSKSSKHGSDRGRFNERGLRL